MITAWPGSPSRAASSDSRVESGAISSAGMIGGRDGDYILTVQGESMKDAGIVDGDYVVVRPAPEARDGEIVVAMLDEEDATVKRFSSARMLGPT